MDVMVIKTEPPETETTPKKGDNDELGGGSSSKSLQSTPSRSSDRLLNELKETRKKYNQAVFDLEMYKKASEPEDITSKRQLEEESASINYEKIVALQQKEIEQLQTENEKKKNDLESLDVVKLELLENAVKFEARLKDLSHTNSQLEKEKKDVAESLQARLNLYREENSLLKSNLETEQKAKENQLALLDVEKRKLIDENSLLQKQFDQEKSIAFIPFFNLCVKFILFYLHFSFI